MASLLSGLGWLIIIIDVGFMIIDNYAESQIIKSWYSVDDYISIFVIGLLIILIGSFA